MYMQAPTQVTTVKQSSSAPHCPFRLLTGVSPVIRIHWQPTFTRRLLLSRPDHASFSLGLPSMVRSSRLACRRVFGCLPACAKYRLCPSPDELGVTLLLRFRRSFARFFRLIPSRRSVDTSWVAIRIKTCYLEKQTKLLIEFNLLVMISLWLAWKARKIRS